MASGVDPSLSAADLRCARQQLRAAWHDPAPSDAFWVRTPLVLPDAGTVDAQRVAVRVFCAQCARRSARSRTEALKRGLVQTPGPQQ